MNVPLACPVDHSPLQPDPEGLRSATGRLYPPLAGGWDLRPTAADALAGEMAEIYDAMTGEMTDFRHPHNLTLVAQREWLDRLALPAGARVLEIGGHRSGVLAYLEATGGVLGAGVDISPAWVAAQNAACDARGSGTRWVVADATSLPYSSKTFDAVVAFDVLEHVAHLERAVAEVFRVLRVGGRVLVHMPVADIEGSLDGLSRWRDPADFASRQASVGHYHERMPSRQRLRILFEHVGFHVLDTAPFNVWLQPVHDYRILPALGRLRRRLGRAGGGGAGKDGAGKGGAPVSTGPSGFQRAYAASVIPVARALSAVDRVGRELGFGGSEFLLAERPAANADPLRRPGG